MTTTALRAEFKIEELTKLYNLSEGQLITVQGKCTGDDFLFSSYTHMADCILIDGSTPTPTPTPTNPEIIYVSATQLSHDYDANPLAANNKYLDKILQVTGTIINIGESGGTPYITFDDDIMFSTTSIKAEFKIEELTKLYNLSAGQLITIQGKCTGDGFLYTYMVDCILIDGS